MSTLMHCRRRVSATFGVAGALLLALLARPAQAAVELAPGLWVDQESQRAFLSNPSGLPEARALSDGRLLWTGDEPARLLLQMGAHWLALGQPEQVGWGRLLVLDSASGRQVKQLPFELPQGVSATVGAEPQRRFDARAEAIGDGVRLHWRFEAQPLRGALLEDSGAAVASEGISDEGVVDIDFSGARALALPRRDVKPQPLPRGPDLQPEQRITGLGERQFRSADDAHVLAPEPKQDSQFGIVWRWNFASRARGRLDASLELPFALAPFLLQDAHLLYQAPPLSYARADGSWQHHGLRLVMHELESGRELWSAELLDTVFRGVLPP